MCASQPECETGTQNLKTLEEDLIAMAKLVEEAIADSVESLATQSITLAEKVIERDALINKMQIDIEEDCMKLIALERPDAEALRQISATLKIIIDLERVADNAVNIAKIAKRISGQPLIKPLIDIPRMAKIAQKMVKDSLTAYLARDMDLAREMTHHDDQVDHLYNQVFRELLTYMLENPRTIAQATHLLLVTRHLERIADHATNIGENVIYLVSGERVDLNS